MIGLILVTHGRLAEELRSAMEHVVGKQRNVATVCIGPDDDIEGRRAEIVSCINQVDTGDGVVLLTDMFGGTPSNLAISQMDRKGVEVIAGVNLPMLVKLAKVRSNQPLADAVDCAQNAGRKYIAAASHVLPHCKLPPCKINEVLRMTPADGPDQGPADGDSSGGSGGPVLSRMLTICNRRGLHARAAAKFVTTAERFGASVDVVKDGQSVSARSIMGLMMLGAGQGSEIELRGEGWDAKEAMDALAALVEAGFNEQD